LTVDRTIRQGDKTIYHYDIDVREFLSIEKNAVIKKLVKSLIRSLPEEERSRFYTSDPGNRDFRVKCCQRYLSRFSYRPSKGKYDTWQFPEETIVLKSGDCEDFAFLPAAMVEACDISPYCFRVVFGSVTDYSGPRPRSWDHAWLTYHDEYGAWQIIEPIQFVKYVKPKAAKTKGSVVQPQFTDTEYRPHYVFNRDHLWRVRSNDTAIRTDFVPYINERNYFNKFHPFFAASVHNDIFDQALSKLSWFTRERIKAVSLYVDVNTASYDPRDHFDFAYVNESWQRVQSRLAKGTLTDFALAAHAIADFYAHSLYGFL
jgi:hypothetical protein